MAPLSPESAAPLPPRPLRVGLTGGIGSGKSTVGTMLVAHGATLIDTDAIARELTAPGGVAMPAIEHAFGPSLRAADGALDRAAMRALVFSDAGAKARLEAILHPLIAAEVVRRAGEAGAAPVVVFDVPLLVESGRWRDRVDRVVVVDASEATQRRRVAARPGWSDADAARVIAQQATREARRAAADVVIDNDDDDLPRLRAAVAALWQRWAAPGPATG